jgi:hypothetical protein
VDPLRLIASDGPVGAGNPPLTGTLLLFGTVLSVLWAWRALRRRPQLTGRGVRWWFRNRDRDERFWFWEFGAAVALAVVLVGWLVALLTM